MAIFQRGQRGRGVRLVTPAEVGAGGRDVQIVDVREDDEWRAGRIDGAQHIPLAQLPTRLDELDRDRPVVAVCRSGSRSGHAASFLGRQGYDVANLEGGVKAWVAEGLPLTTPDGRPGTVA